jgi:HK97 family phage major capsid protein
VWEQVAAPVRKLAHYTRVNDEVLADFDNFRTVVSSEMIAGLIATENDQLLNGDGNAPNLTGQW